MTAGQSRPYVELVGTFGVTYRQLDHWARCGYIHVPRDGSGNLRYIDPDEEDVARMMCRLVDVGLSPLAAHKAARDLAVADAEPVQLGNGIGILDLALICEAS